MLLLVRMTPLVKIEIITNKNTYSPQAMDVTVRVCMTPLVACDYNNVYDKLITLLHTPFYGMVRKKNNYLLTTSLACYSKAVYNTSCYNVRLCMTTPFIFSPQANQFMLQLEGV